MNAKPLLAILISTVFSAAFAGSADEAMNQSMGHYRSAEARGQWTNPWMPSATGNRIAQGPSADYRLMQIVVAYTRDALDRGGWQNTTMTNSTYAAGKALVTADIGDGVTISAVSEPRISGYEHLTRIIASYTRELLDRGGWRNEFVSGDHYAAGEPLRTAAVGQGVTTRESAPAGLTVHIAARSPHSTERKS